MKNVICIIARTNSKRLEKKVLKEIANTTMIEFIIANMKKCKYADEIYICTSRENEDQILIDIAKKNQIKYYAGDSNSPIERLLKVAEIENADNVVRVTGDNIFTDSLYLDLMFENHIKTASDYTRTEFLPIGMTPEIINANALKRCFNKIPPDFSEYLMLYMFQPSDFKCLVLFPPLKHQKPFWSMTVDNQDDWDRTIDIFNSIKMVDFNFNDIIDVCESNEIRNLEYKINGQIKMPGNFTISFKAFRCEMEMRILMSQQINISESEYVKKTNE